MSYPLLDVFLTMMFFFLWVLWIYLLVRVIADIFRSRDIGGWGKAGWLAFVIFLPFLGVFGYLIARGGEMADRESGQTQESARLHGQADSRTDALAKLDDLHNHGAISDADYQRSKDKVLSGTSG
jgi:phospholipase D-like protein/putative oligomerization/nucleic acid binding protein